ncbi:hypothetical protein AB4Y85_08800 [Microvirga sp. 2YAF29]|uniref:hypothetical protein n=1 Tax=Microvirga sp. 2YAF29 TaxID=3233031 RepID=UPI003F9E543A
MRTSLKTLLAAALIFGGATALETTDASAQPRWGARAPAGDTYAPRFGGRAYGPPGAYYRYRGGYGYRPAYGYRSGYYGRRYGGYPYYGYRGGYRYYNGGAAAAGLVGGLALGAIAGAASNPYYHGSGYYRPAYYAPGHCVVERRRVVNRYGRVVFQRVRTCY